MRTSFHHQPEAQHPKFSAIHKCAGRLPHLWVISGHESANQEVRFPTQSEKGSSWAALLGGILSLRPMTEPPPIREAYLSGLRSRSVYSICAATTRIAKMRVVAIE